MDDGASYFGPYYNGFAIKKALRYLRKVFPYYTKPLNKNSKDKKLDLDAHIGLSPTDFSSVEYKKSLRKLIKYIRGESAGIIKELESEMSIAAQKQDFEAAAKSRNKIYNLKELQHRIMFGDKEFLDISKDVALSDLTEMLNLEKIPARIEGFDISHLSGKNVVASMVVFSNGVSNRSEYRKFKTSIDQNNDFENMQETISRRFSEKNIKSWGMPDLVLIDGGKGQLDAAISSFPRHIKDVALIGLAKKEEQIIIKSNYDINFQKINNLTGGVDKTDGFVTINLPKNSHIIKLLQRIRDESHRFAVSYHTVLRNKSQNKSILDEIPGIGPKTRSKIIKKFGHVSGIKDATESEVINLIGKSKAKIVLESQKK
jgi:excinuclease ABC subunit C